MRIDHISIYATDPDVQKDFYVKYFGAIPNRDSLDDNEKSYFLTFDDGAKLEIINREDIRRYQKNHIDLGYIRLAFGFGSKDEVDTLVDRLQEDGYQIRHYPRLTKDGYYEAVVIDPDDNQIILSYGERGGVHCPPDQQTWAPEDVLESDTVELEPALV